MKRLWKSEDGQALPLVMLFLMVLMGVLALVLDGGNGFTQRRRMQNAADAAAISTAMTIVKGEYRDTAVRQMATQYAQSNGALSANLRYLDSNGNLLPNPADGVVPMAANAIQVTTQRTFPTFFARLLGFQTMTASAQATAKAVPGTPKTTMLGLAPLTVPTNFEAACGHATDSCDIWDSTFAKIWGLKATQYKSLVDLSNNTIPGNKPNLLGTWTYGGYPGDISTNVWLPIYGGDVGNNISNNLRQHVSDFAEGIDADGVVWGSIGMVVWDAFNNNSIHVAKFARFKVRMTDVYSSHTYGHFINYLVDGHGRGIETTTPGPTIVVLGN